MAALDIGIAGGGLLGRLLAWQLAGQGHRVSVFDAAATPSERGAAGWTAAGMLSPLAELECGDARLAALGLRSLDLWAGIVRGLPQPVDFHRDGSLLLAHGPDLATASRLLAQIEARAPADRAPQRLDAARLRQLEPEVHGPAHAWLLAEEGRIHTVQAMQALADAALRRGARWHGAYSVRTIGPGRIDAARFDWVFDVRGVGARPDLPVRGVRGEILWLHAPGLVLRRPLRLLHPRSKVYLVPRPGELIVVGASEIESEDRSPVSVRTLVGLLSAAHSVMPGLAEARVVHTETNLRPALPDNLPQLAVQEGLTRINGLFRHGWMIAPALVEDALRHPLFAQRDGAAAPSSEAEAAA